MSALVRSEVLKIRTTRSWWGYLIVVVLISGIAVAGEIGPANNADRGSPEFQLGLVETIGVAALISVILGITIITLEFRHGTVTPSFLAEPRRERVIAAKAIAGALVAAGFALLSLLVVVAVALPWYSIVGAETRLSDGELGTRVAQQILLTLLWALMGVAIGTLVHSQVAALVGTLVWIFLGETLLMGLFGLIDIDGTSAYLPFQALDAVDGTGGDGLLSYWPGVGISLGWIALLGVAGTERTRRRDIS